LPSHQSHHPLSCSTSSVNSVLRHLSPLSHIPSISPPFSSHLLDFQGVIHVRMSPYSVPWPEQTPHPTASTSSSSPITVQKRGKRAATTPRSDKAVMLQLRGIANQTEIDGAKEECFDSSNAVWSCWPINTSIVDQGDSTQFVWNSNQPSIRQFNLVDIALIRADNGHTVSTFLNTPNPTNRAGFIPLTVDDPWWGSDGSRWD